MVVTCTGGERGEVLNPKLADDAEIAANLPEVRRREMDRAREILGRAAGVARVRRLRLPRGLHRRRPWTGCPRAASRGMPVDEAARPLVALMRHFRPHVVTTYDEQGGYPHPDHIMCHQVTVAAFDAAG